MGFRFALSALHFIATRTLTPETRNPKLATRRPVAFQSSIINRQSSIIKEKGYEKNLAADPCWQSVSGEKRHPGCLPRDPTPDAASHFTGCNRSRSIGVLEYWSIGTKQGAQMRSNAGRQHGQSTAKQTDCTNFLVS